MAARSSSSASLPALPRAASTSSTRRPEQRSGRSSSRRQMRTSASASWSPTGDTVSYWPSRDHAGDGCGSGRTSCRRMAAATGCSPPGPGSCTTPAGSDWSNDGTRMVVTCRDASDGTASECSSCRRMATRPRSRSHVTPVLRGTNFGEHPVDLVARRPGAPRHPRRRGRVRSALPRRPRDRTDHADGLGCGPASRLGNGRRPDQDLGCRRVVPPASSRPGRSIWLPSEVPRDLAVAPILTQSG